VEVASALDQPVSGVKWQKAARSQGNGGACAELAAVAHLVAVRDSKDPDGPNLVFSLTAWSAFCEGAKTGTFDLI
jgi:hypothetical protein